MNHRKEHYNIITLTSSSASESTDASGSNNGADPLSLIAEVETPILEKKDSVEEHHLAYGIQEVVSMNSFDTRNSARQVLQMT